MRGRTPTFIIGHYSLGREGLRRIIGTSRFEIVGAAACLDDVSEGASGGTDCPLLILLLGDEFDADLRTIERFRKLAPAGRVAVVGRHWDLPHAVAAFDAGANACLAEGADGATFVKSLELIMLGETIWPREVLPRLAAAPNAPVAEVGDDRDSDVSADAAAATEADNNPEFQLSRQEMRILDCLAEGESNKQIARKLDIAEATVKVHVKAILRKMRVSNRTQAAVWALRGASNRPARNFPAAIDPAVRTRARN